MKEEKINLYFVFKERNQIISCFPTPVELTPLLTTDIANHAYWIRMVYHGMLHDAGVVDECCQRFEKEFGGLNWEQV